MDMSYLTDASYAPTKGFDCAIRITDLSSCIVGSLKPLKGFSFKKIKVPRCSTTLPFPNPYARASSTILNGACAARRIRVKPPATITSRSFFSPAWVPSAACPSCANEAGVQIMVEAA